jgi:hypothetical protein
MKNNGSFEHKSMLEHCKMIFGGWMVNVSPCFEKLITALRTAVENGEGRLDKDATSYDDVFGAFRLVLKYYVFK